MECTWAGFANRREVLFRRVALVRVKVIGRPSRRFLDHQVVPKYLGDYRSRRDRPADRVALENADRGPSSAGQWKVVHYHAIGLRRNLVDRRGHRQPGGRRDSNAVDQVRRHNAVGNLATRSDLMSNPPAPGVVQLFGVAHFAKRLRREQIQGNSTGCRDYRAGYRAAPNLVDADDAAAPKTSERLFEWYRRLDGLLRRAGLPATAAP